MKKILLSLIFCASLFSGFDTKAQVSVTVFDDILFYDGYAATVDLATHPVPDGVIRHRNDLYAKKLTADQLASFGSSMTMNVTIKAACDNYDRIGNVNLAFVPIGATTYNPDDVQRIELGRFITPFMNKNIEPTEVPYTFAIDNVAKIFKDATLLAAYDIWVELEVFGVPYAAQTQVSGCAGRIDVFYGTLEFASNSLPISGADNFLLPLNFKKNLNNYEPGASDAIGTTVRTINFTLAEPLTNAKFYLITSSHGANAGGEEYNRRLHRLYFDNAQFGQYVPGGVSCEPYRIYNTQGNGIYGPTPRTDAEWASFSNWCPGQVIPIRSYGIGAGNMAAGDHSFKITVNAAVFVDQQGYIPVSLYLQGNLIPLGTQNFPIVNYALTPNPTDGMVTIESSSPIKNVKIFNLIGQQIGEQFTNEIDLSPLSKGVYIVKLEFDNGKIFTEKIIKE